MGELTQLVQYIFFRQMNSVNLMQYSGFVPESFLTPQNVKHNA